MLAQKATMGRPKKDGPTENYRITMRLARMLRQLAVDADMDAADYFTSEFGSLVKKKHQAMVERLAKEGRKEMATIDPVCVQAKT
jgi:hypothetical protein